VKLDFSDNRGSEESPCEPDEALGICTPLSQTNFLPDLMHVKVLPEAKEVIPTVLQVDPALTAAFEGTRDIEKERPSTDRNAISFLFI